MIGLDDLRDARPTALEESSAAWRRLATRFKTLGHDSISDLIGPIHQSGWEGDAAQAAFPYINGVAEGFGLLAEQAREVGVLVGTVASRFAVFQRQLVEIEQDARAGGARVRADGDVEPAYLTTEESADEKKALLAARRNDEAAQVLADRIRALLIEANQVDDEYATALGRYVHPPSGVMSASEVRSVAQDARDNAALLGADKSTIPTGKSAWTVRQWWEGLTADQRQAYLDAYPDQIGSLNGIPTVDRDQANRALLQVDATATAGYSGRSQRLLDRLITSEYGPPQRRLYLLGIDNHANGGYGRVIVAVGNPDTAQHVAVYVPGMNTNLDGINGDIDRADHMQLTGDRTAGHTGSTAAVMWLNYDSPQAPFDLKSAEKDPMGELKGGLEGASTQNGVQGGVLLDQFVNGLHATHTGAPANYTAVGHSYGSTVVGESASNGHVLNVQDIIVAGSPGMDVHTVNDLNVPRQHVWAGAASDDPVVQYLSGLSHDTSPVDPAFGANQFHVDTHGHSDYWNLHSQSLNNQALIIAGQGDNAVLDHHSASPDTGRIWNPAGGPLVLPR